MEKLIVELKQHTPIIHFQAHQNGATLRASELKPKLDKFLIKKFKENNIYYRKWLISSGEREALNYMIKIIYTGDSWKHYIEEPKTENGGFKKKQNEDGTYSTETYSYPMFFGNMGKNYEDERSIKKFVLADNDLKLDIHSFKPALIKYIKDYFHEFIALENFGSRQDKGFGSFYISESNENYKPVTEELFDYKFNIQADIKGDLTQKFKSIFNQIDLFYRSLRSGINTKAHDRVTTTFYFKSLLFLHFKKQNIQWEKKTIKEEFFWNDGKNYDGLKKQIANLPLSDALQYSSKDKKLVKDLFGLSTEESWLYYNKNSITKTEAKDDKYGNKIKKNKNEEQIVRFKSPIFFKIIESIKSGNYVVYLKLNDDIPIRGKWFIIENKYGKSFALQIPNQFNLHDFFVFITDQTKFNICTHVDEQFHNAEQYKILERIYNSLRPIA